MYKRVTKKVTSTLDLQGVHCAQGFVCTGSVQGMYESWYEKIHTNWISCDFCKKRIFPSQFQFSRLKAYRDNHLDLWIGFIFFFNPCLWKHMVLYLFLIFDGYTKEKEWERKAMGVNIAFQLSTTPTFPINIHWPALSSLPGSSSSTTFDLFLSNIIIISIKGGVWM